MGKSDSRNLRGEALAARASELGIGLEDFRDADGSIREVDLQRRVREVERYSAEFRVGGLLVACIAAFIVCGFAAWVAVHFLWHAHA